jgi:hypothetical protein
VSYSWSTDPRLGRISASGAVPQGQGRPAQDFNPGCGGTHRRESKILWRGMRRKLPRRSPRAPPRALASEPVVTRKICSSRRRPVFSGGSPKISLSFGKSRSFWENLGRVQKISVSLGKSRSRSEKSHFRCKKVTLVSKISVSFGKSRSRFRFLRLAETDRWSDRRASRSRRRRRGRPAACAPIPLPRQHRPAQADPRLNL